VIFSSHVLPEVMLESWILMVYQYFQIVLWEYMVKTISRRHIPAWE
jgi:hypothetical protein